MLISGRVQLLTIILVILALLSLSCGGKGQEIREMTAEKLQGVAEKLADEGTGTSTPSPIPETSPTNVPSITSLPTVAATALPASVATTTPIPPPAPTVEATPPTIPTTNAPIPTPTVTPPSAAALPASITVEPQSAEPGEVVTVTGSGFPPYSSVQQLAFNISGIDSISVLPSIQIATDASGEFTTDMLIFSLPNGDHEVVATVGVTSTTTTFTVTGSTYLSKIDYPAASINVEPVSAAPGALVTITGSGFPPFGLVLQLRMGGIDVLPAPQPNTDSIGNLTTKTLIPKLGLGTTQVEIVIVGFNYPSASTPITIVSAIPASITVEPQSAEPGEVVTVTGSGFPPFTSLASLYLSGISVLPPFPNATDASGEFTTDVMMPQLPNGVHEVVVTVGSTSTTTTFTVTGSLH